MLKMIILGFEDFVLSQSGFLFSIIDKIASKLNKGIDDKLTTEINAIIDSKNQTNVFDKLFDEISDRWNIPSDQLKKQFELQGKTMIETNSLILSDQWINTFQAINNHQIELMFVSIFDIKINPFKNYDFEGKLPQFVNISLCENDVDLDHNQQVFIDAINQSNNQISDVLLITNRVDLFELSKTMGIKIFTRNEEVDKNYLKNQKVSQIDSNSNVESWIYQFLTETTDQFS